MTESEKVKKWFDSELSMRPEESLDSVECEEVKEICLNAIEEVEQYRAIGTVSEFRELKKKATAKKPKKVAGYGIFDCPHCNRVLFASDGHKYCPRCGGLLDWSEGRE